MVNTNITIRVITARKRSLRRLCFYRCLSVHTGACVVALGGCMFFLGGHVWFFLGGHAWFSRGGMHGCSCGGGMCGFSGGACVVFSINRETLRGGNMIHQVLGPIYIKHQC